LTLIDALILANQSTLVNTKRGNMPSAIEVTEVEPGFCCQPLLATPLSVDEAEELSRLFTALGDPVRLRLLSLIATAGPVCACDLVGPVGRSQPTISHHTKALAEVGLITGEKRGRWVWWSIVPSRLELLRTTLAPANAR
jgi:ArsR family transcriptional regulator